MMLRIVAEGRLPFDPIIPNKKTIAAIKEARRGGLKSYKSSADVMAALNEDN
jgi:DNA-damage-inducible protein J